MGKFRYTARTADGKAVRGLKNAEGKSELFEQLRASQLYPVSIRRVTLSGLMGRSPLKKKELADFCRQAGAMLSAGIPMDTCLGVLAGQEQRERYAALYEDMKNSVRQGGSLSGAMKERDGVFPEILIQMAHMGENGGRLDKVLADMGKRFELEDRMEQRLRLASLYPALLFAFTLVMVVIIFGFVLPSFYGMFDEMEVPGYTRFLLQLSAVFQEQRHWLAAGFCGLVLLVWTAGKMDPVRLCLDKRRVRSRLTSRYYRMLYTARFAGALGPLYSSGLPMVECLKLCRQAADNLFVKEQMQILIDKVENGVALSQAVGQVEGFDKKLQTSISVGEESGRLMEMLERISELFQEETERMMQKAAALLEPAMILVMAAIIGYVAVSVMIPIYQYYQSIG